MKFERLKEIREDRNLTQEDIAQKLNVERSTYAGWETGKDSIPLRRLNKLSDYYEVSVDYLTGLSNVTNTYRVIDLDAKVVGHNLKSLRKKHNLLQKDIYSLLNTTSSTYSAYETGKILIKTDFLFSICKNYQESMDKVLGKKH